MAKLWLVKDKKGRIFGPYNEQEICFYIEEREFKGEELFSSYPVGRWKPLSVHPVFHEKILAALHQKDLGLYSKTKSSAKSISDSEYSVEEVLEPTRIVNPREMTSSKQEQLKKKVKIKLSEKFKEKILEDEDVIEMEEFKIKFSDGLKSSLKIPILIFVGLSIFTIVFLFKDVKKSGHEERIHLLTMGTAKKTWTKEEIDKKKKMAPVAFFKGTISGYMDAQRHFVHLLEENPDKIEIYHYLCLSYLEVWPFTYQDTKDKNTIYNTVNLASGKDQQGIFSGLCKSVQAYIEQKPERALMIINSVLKGENVTSFIIFLYYMKAKALKALNKMNEAGNQLRNINQLNPKWIAPYLLSAQMFYDDKKYDLAVKTYQRVLEISSGHPSANLRMGILEYKYLKKYDKSKKRLSAVLTDLNSIISPDILLEAYIALANIYLRQNDKNKVVEYSNKAYALDPDSPDVVLLKNKLGKSAQFEDTEVKAWGLIHRGDILVSQGKLSEARTYFRKAYHAGQEKNALAALKMARCYWQSGFSGQAIVWLKKSINADPKMLEAYFLLADYFSQIYNFQNAQDILNTVRSQSPSNYDLFKAYAFLSFHQKHYKAAIAYAKRSLDFYTSDTEVYILLSKAHRALGDGNKSFVYGQKAIQEDVSNIQAQITYALSTKLAYGYHKAHNYFKELIKHFPLIIEYSQALGEFYFDNEMYDEALVTFNIIHSHRPKFKPALISLGKFYSRLSRTEKKLGQNYDKALQFFVSASLLDISDPEPLFLKASLYTHHELYQFAEGEYEKILNMYHNYPLIHYYIGLVNFYQQGKENLEKALKFAKIQAAKTPKHYLPYKLAGDTYRLLSKGVFHTPQERQATYELCAKEYQNALKYFKDNPEISIGLMECYREAGNFDSALQLGMQMIKTEGFSGYADTYREIGRIFEARNEYEKAKVYYNSYFSLKPGAKDRKEIENRINNLIRSKRTISTSKSGKEGHKRK